MVLNFPQLLIIVLSILVKNKFSTLTIFPLGLIPQKSVWGRNTEEEVSLKKTENSNYLFRDTSKSFIILIISNS